jgi:hypothetical protein
MTTLELINMLADADKYCVMLANEDGNTEAIIYVDEYGCLVHCCVDDNSNLTHTQHSEPVQFEDLALLQEYAKFVQLYGEERVSYC